MHADLRSVEVEEVLKATTETATKLFGLRAG
jgi:hypothetical protein